MTNEQRGDDAPDQEESGGIGPTNLAASAAEAGSVYGDRGPTAATEEGQPVGLDASPESDQGQSTGDLSRGER